MIKTMIMNNSKLFTILFLLVCAMSSLNLRAQITEAKIIYEVKMDSDDPMISQQLSMMTGSSMTISFKESNFRQDMDMNMMKTTTIHNAKKEEGILLIEMMGIKKAARIESLLNLEKTDSSSSESSEIEVSDETRTISGYKCSKVIVEDSTGMEMIMFVTNELKANNNQNKYGNSKVKGFPLSIEIEMAQLSMTMTATEVVSKVKNSVFNTSIPDGYEETSAEELMKMMSGMK